MEDVGEPRAEFGELDMGVSGVVWYGTSGTVGERMIDAICGIRDFEGTTQSCACFMRVFHRFDSAEGLTAVYFLPGTYVCMYT
jgi:hypothetical protein